MVILGIGGKKLIIGPEVGHLHVGIVLHPLWHVEYNVSFETLSPPLFAYERSSILKVSVTTECLHFLPSILLTLEVVLVYLDTIFTSFLASSTRLDVIICDILDVVEAVDENNYVLHGADSTLACAWLHLKGITAS